MRRMIGLCFALIATMALAAAPARAAATPERTIQGFYATLLDTMKHAGALGQKGRYEALAPAIRGSFDLAGMAQMAVGPAWRSFSPEQRRNVAAAFARYTIATYADRFDGYGGERLEVTGERSTPFGTIVESRIVKSDGKPISIDYLMHRQGDDWRIADIYLTGTVSQVAALRSQFVAVLAQHGVEGLIATLKQKADMLVASSTGS